MKRWISYPELYPHRCVWSQQDSQEAGPYLDCGMTYFAARDVDGRTEPDRRPAELYISPQSLIEAGNLPGSPVAVVPKQEWLELLQYAEAEAEGRARLDKELAEAKETLGEAKRRMAAMADPEKIAEKIAESFDDRYAKKTGRKPQGQTA